jgi:4-hydroxy-tetrahydrodipicolinate reductase
MNYGIVGFSGRMGREIASLFQEKGHNLVFRCDDKSSEITSEPEVVIDFSLSNALDKTIEIVRRFKCPLITGVTGYSEAQMTQIRNLAKAVAVVQSFNYSIGIQLMLKLTGLLKEPLRDWDVEISETHHRFKKDKPSGTAQMLAAALERPVAISSLRLGNVPGDHTITFGGLGETLSITHRVLSRRTFAEGVLLSAEFARKFTYGYFTFTDVLFHNQNQRPV